MTEWRFLLYYPLGLLPSLFFSLRFLIQWIKSEKKGSSVVEPMFWKLSIAGNFLLFLHYFIQIQYPFAILQAGNAILAWRNLHLMENKSPLPFKSMLLLLGCVLGISIYLCFLQNLLLGETTWLKVPLLTEEKSLLSPAVTWTAIGCAGQLLFSSRFWVQWWQAESSNKSELTSIFWWMSLAGSAISVTYFSYVQDVISLLNHGFGMIPYMRNLMLLARTKKPKVVIPTDVQQVL